MKHILIIILCLFGFSQIIVAQQTSSATDAHMQEEAAIKVALQKYIDGSTGGQPKLLQEVFHPDLNLYYVRDNKIKAWSGLDYIADTKEGKPTGELGKILSVDYTNNAAMAKVEIANADRTSVYIDYFMLLKTDNEWTIVHKMFTKQLD